MLILPLTATLQLGATYVPVIVPLLTAAVTLNGHVPARGEVSVMETLDAFTLPESEPLLLLLTF